MNTDKKERRARFIRVHRWPIRLGSCGATAHPDSSANRSYGETSGVQSLGAADMSVRATSESQTRKRRVANSPQDAIPPHITLSNFHPDLVITPFRRFIRLRNMIGP